MLDLHARSIHLLVAIAMLGILLVGCPPGNGGGDEGLGEDGAGEGVSEGSCEDSIEGEGEPYDSNFDVETITLPGGVELEMISIPAGTFMMGSTFLISVRPPSTIEMPVHSVTISKEFRLGRTEVTKAQWEAVMGTTPWSGEDFVLDDPDSPAVFVHWTDAQRFVYALTDLTGEVFRLPSEAEWEYACRAGTTTEYSFGDCEEDLSDYAWWDGNADFAGETYAHVVGQLLPNPFGLFDMHGNVFEWCEDWFDNEYYPVSPSIDPPGPSTGQSKVIRGGTWALNARNCRSARRKWGIPGGGGNFLSRSTIIGFRLAR